MHAGTRIEAGTSTREIIREMRLRGTRAGDRENALPESDLWRLYCELRTRGENNADSLLLRGLKQLHDRRASGISDLSHIDPDPHEHKLVSDAYLGELWRAYKRCICADRVAPAGQLLKDIEDQLTGH